MIDTHHPWCRCGQVNRVNVTASHRQCFPSLRVRHLLQLRYTQQRGGRVDQGQRGRLQAGVLAQRTPPALREGDFPQQPTSHARRRRRRRLMILKVLFTRPRHFFKRSVTLLCCQPGISTEHGKVD